MPKLKWQECGKEEGGGFKAETPIGDYVVFGLNDADNPNLWVAELWDGPDKQDSNLGKGYSQKWAIGHAQDHYNSIYRQMTYNTGGERAPR